MARAVKGSLGQTPAKGVFIEGAAGEKKPLAGVIHKGKDLRANPSKNQGKMPSSMT
jgi:hypothetical protein